MSVTKKSLDDIFAEHDPFGLLDVKPAQSEPDAATLLDARVDEMVAFINQAHRLPQPSSTDFNERVMAKRLAATLVHCLDRICQAIQDPEIARRLRQDFGSPEAPSAEAPPQNPTPMTAILEQTQKAASLDEILSADPLGLLDMGDESIFNLAHVPYVDREERAASDEVASRKRCSDFHRFDHLFKRVRTELKTGLAKTIRFEKVLKIEAGEYYILDGLTCFVAEVGKEERRIDRMDARLRLIFDNGTESNMLRRSLAKVLYDDENGRRILRDASIDLEAGFTDLRIKPEDRRTGIIYILRTKSTHPGLTAIPNLLKIGYTEQSLTDRLRHAEEEPTFLESAVEVVTSFECYNMDPQRFESLVHGFLNAQRLNVELISKNGKSYRPREWFMVSLDVAREVINRITDGTIVNYRMDNTTVRVVSKRS